MYQCRQNCVTLVINKFTHKYACSLMGCYLAVYFASGISGLCNSLHMGSGFNHREVSMDLSETEQNC